VTDRYKWVALSNCTLAVLLATLDASITLIAMPDIFRGIHLDPLVASNSFYLLWMILGYLVVTTELRHGRAGDGGRGDRDRPGGALNRAPQRAGTSPFAAEERGHAVAIIERALVKDLRNAASTAFPGPATRGFFVRERT
jgi:hypothetical protein